MIDWKLLACILFVNYMVACAIIGWQWGKSRLRNEVIERKEAECLILHTRDHHNGAFMAQRLAEIVEEGADIIDAQKAAVELSYRHHKNPEVRAQWQRILWRDAEDQDPHFAEVARVVILNYMTINTDQLSPADRDAIFAAACHGSTEFIRDTAFIPLVTIERREGVNK